MLPRFRSALRIYPVTGGFAWIHWLAANITRFEIRENESQAADDFVQGRNSWTSIQGGEQTTELSCYYGGMTPPDKPHIYELHVYALDKMLDLERGFLLNELYREMDGHILDQFTLKGYMGIKWLACLRKWDNIREGSYIGSLLIYRLIPLALF